MNYLIGHFMILFEILNFFITLKEVKMKYINIE